MTFSHLLRHRAAKLGCAIAAVLSVVSASTPVNGLPLVSGNFNIAQQFLHGDAHVVVLGDSEQNVLMGTYPTHWHIDHWSGQANLNEANGPERCPECGAVASRDAG